MLKDILAPNTTLYQASLTWLRLGAKLLPCQKNRKHFLSGFGPTRRVIDSDDQARQYFDDGGYNLAVLLPRDVFCLDFDDLQLFQDWKSKAPAELQRTYEEFTPRGFHVFYRGDLPAGLHLVPGAEVKRHCLVAPSVVAGVPYVVAADRNIQSVTDIKSLVFPLLSGGVDWRYSPPDDHYRGIVRGGNDLISRIKNTRPVFDYASSLTELKLSSPGQARWYIGRCPLHDDTNPSFWVDRERDLWGCFSPECLGYTGAGVRGHDVINLYALVNSIDNHEAVRRLARGLE